MVRLFICGRQAGRFSYLAGDAMTQVLKIPVENEDIIVSADFTVRQLWEILKMMELMLSMGDDSIYRTYEDTFAIIMPYGQIVERTDNADTNAPI